MVSAAHLPKITHKNGAATFTFFSCQIDPFYPTLFKWSKLKFEILHSFLDPPLLPWRFTSPQKYLVYPFACQVKNRLVDGVILYFNLISGLDNSISFGKNN